MKEYKFTPQACNETQNDEGEKIPATFKGNVTLRVPRYQERQDFRSLAINMVLEDDKKEQQVLSIPSMTKMIELSKSFYISAELESLDDGTKFTTFEEMEYDPRCEGILNEIAIQLSRGIIPSKN